MQRKQTAWDYLDNTLQPDVALVQEAPRPSERTDRIALLHEVSCAGDAGKVGVVLQGLPYRRVEQVQKQKQTWEVKQTHPGCFMIIEITLPSAMQVTVISLYGLLERPGSYSITTLHRMLSDLTPVLDWQRPKPHVIIGGDWNASLQWDERQKNHSHQLFFERLKDFGLEDCLAKYYRGFVQTLRRANSTVPWQNDYLYASPSLIQLLIQCEVKTVDAAQSDHNPIVAMFDLR